MAKKQELKAMIDSDAQPEKQQPNSKILAQTIKKAARRIEQPVDPGKATVRGQSPPPATSDRDHENAPERLAENPVLRAYEPSEAEKIALRELENAQHYYVTILNVFATADDRLTTTFNKNDLIRFHIVAAATEMFARLSADFCLEATAQDLSNFLPQKIYAFSFQDKLKYSCFEIIFESKALLEGVFRLQVIFSLGHVEYFAVNNDFIYRVIE